MKYFILFVLFVLFSRSHTPCLEGRGIAWEKKERKKNTLPEKAPLPPNHYLFLLMVLPNNFIVFLSAFVTFFPFFPLFNIRIIVEAQRDEEGYCYMKIRKRTGECKKRMKLKQGKGDCCSNGGAGWSLTKRGRESAASLANHYFQVSVLFYKRAGRFN